MKLKCVCCESMDGTPRVVGDELMPLCPEHDWGAQDINEANRAGESWSRFWSKLQSLGLRFRPLYGYTPTSKKRKVYKN